MRLKRETQGAFCVLNPNAKSQTRKSMKINVICTVPPILASDCKWRSCEASPFGRATSRNSLWLVELLIVRLLDTQSRTTGGATMHEWWCDHMRLVVRPCKTYLRLMIADRSQTVLNMTVDWFCSYDHVRSPTTTTISGTFSLRFDSDS